MIKDCVICGGEFSARDDRHHYCSMKCAVEGGKRRYKLQYLALRRLDGIGLDLPGMYEAIHGHPARSSQELSRLALACVDQAGERSSLESELDRASDWTYATGRPATCVICGETFPSWHHAGRTCSAECGKQLRRDYDRDPRNFARHYELECIREGYNQKYRNCTECGKSFLANTSGSQLTCSKECGRIRRATEHRRRLGMALVIPSMRNCAQCGVQFRPLTTVHRFCSAACKEKARASIPGHRARKNKLRRIKARKRRLAGKTQTQSTAKPGSPQWQNLSLTT